MRNVMWNGEYCSKKITFFYLIDNGVDSLHLSAISYNEAEAMNKIIHGGFHK